ncbi:MAG: hydrolase [Planctomycetes bacterium]|nr:hydrolase [Planctomycetota bacterium]
MSTPDSTSDSFVAPWWLRSAHLQTLWATIVRRRVTLETRRERLELSDGDFLDLEHAGGEGGGRPTVLVLHGLAGSVESPYVRGLLRRIAERGWHGVLMHFRGCSGELNRLPRSYHSGETGDMAYVVEALRRRDPASPIAAVGYSLGGNALLKWLGETGAANPLTAAVAVSVPFDLHNAAERMERGLSRVYQWHLLRDLHAMVKAKMRAMDTGLTLTPGEIEALNTFRLFDDRITAPMHGFAGVDDYYTRSSSRQYLAGIGRPTLIVHARDDPFMTPDAVPTPAEVSASVTLEVSEHGGHVGFVESAGGRIGYYLDRRIPAFLAARFTEAGSRI